MQSFKWREARPAVNTHLTELLRAAATMIMTTTKTRYPFYSVVKVKNELRTRK
jgi:hypothetical protein